MVYPKERGDRKVRMRVGEGRGGERKNIGFTFVRVHPSSIMNSIIDLEPNKFKRNLSYVLFLSRVG